MNHDVSSVVIRLCVWSGIWSAIVWYDKLMHFSKLLWKMPKTDFFATICTNIEFLFILNLNKLKKFYCLNILVKTNFRSKNILKLFIVSILQLLYLCY